jgi:membrane-associated phospholipid phosphatase
MRSNIILSTVILVFCFTNVNAQQLRQDKPNDTASTWQLLKYDTTSAFNGVIHSFTRPANWKKKDFATLGIMVLGSVAMSSIDDEVNTFFARQEPNVPKVVKDFGWYVGNPQNYFVATAGIYGYGLFTKNEKVRKTGVLIIASSFTSGLLQSIGKNAIGRARPTSGFTSATFDPFSKESGFHSFPSGHTVLSITMSHSIAKQFENPWTKATIYTLGSIAPISRLLDGAHWLTDIAFSTALSIIVVDCIDKFLFNSNAYTYPRKEKSISWNFKFSTNQIGVIGTF